MKVKNLIRGMILSLSLATAGFSAELKYTGKPFIVNASYKASNIIVLPEPVKTAYSSQKGVQVNYTEDSNRLIVVIPNKPSDLIVEGKSGKLYVFNLNPMALPSQIFVVKNLRLERERRLLFEARSDIDDLIARLIRDVALGKAPVGYEEKNFSKVIASKDTLIVGRKLYRGGSFRIYVIDIVNRTNNVLRVREDTKFAEKVALKIAGLRDTTDLRAISFSKEIIKPKDYVTMYVIVNEKDTPYIWRKTFQRYE